MADNKNYFTPTSGSGNKVGFAIAGEIKNK